MEVRGFVRLCKSFGLVSGKGDATTDERVVFAECHFSGGSGHVGDGAPLGRGLKGSMSGGTVLIVQCGNRDVCVTIGSAPPLDALPLPAQWCFTQHGS